MSENERKRTKMSQNEVVLVPPLGGGHLSPLALAQFCLSWCNDVLARLLFAAARTTYHSVLAGRPLASRRLHSISPTVAGVGLGPRRGAALILALGGVDRVRLRSTGGGFEPAVCGECVLFAPGAGFYLTFIFCRGFEPADRG